MEEETLRLRGQPLPLLDAFRAGRGATRRGPRAVRSILRAAYGLGHRRRSGRRRPRPPGLPRRDRAARRARGLARARRRAVPRGALPRRSSRARSPWRAAEPGSHRRHSTCLAPAHAVPHRLRAWPRGGELPAAAAGLALPRGRGAPRVRHERLRRSRLQRPDPVARERYLFYTACTRASQRCTSSARRRPTTARRARRARSGTRRARSSAATTSSAGRGGGRSRRSPGGSSARPPSASASRALAALAARDEHDAHALACANGWERRLARALGAFERPTR